MADATTTGTHKRTAGTRDVPAAHATATAEPAAKPATDIRAEATYATAMEEPRTSLTPSDEWAGAKPKPWDRMTPTERRVELWRRLHGLPNVAPPDAGA